MMRIPFNRPWVAPRQAEYLTDSLASGWTAGDGPFSARVRALLEDELGCAAVLLAPSCTMALEMAAMLSGLGPGDEFIVPSFTFVTTATAFARQGATPVFCDVDPVTLNLDPASVAERITDRCRAIVPVHYRGLPCDMDALGALAAEHGAHVVEDAAHALFGMHGGAPLGTLSRFGAVSFHETKNFICGEGGALLINRPEDVAAAEIVRDKGTNRAEFFRGQVDKYTWVAMGSSFLLADPLAAMLLAQLEAREEITRRRRERFAGYLERLAPTAADGLCVLPGLPEDPAHVPHIFHVMLPTAAARNHVLSALNAQGIGATFHYVPLHSSPFGSRFGAAPCPVADEVAARLLRLPFFNALEEAEQDEVAAALDRAARAFAG
jgi:dTDP-4-amino-4,6-dideoxygalactose transaminase